MSAETSPAAKARVLIVEDHPIFRDGLVGLINRQADLAVCGEADDARAVAGSVETHRPDLLLLDLMLNGAGGVELVQQLRALFPELPILVLSMHEEAVYAERVLRAGARGFLMKQEASGTVIAAIRTVLGGDFFVSRKLTVSLLQKALAVPEPTATEGVLKLTNRELHVFQLIGAGVATREIAARLGISVKTAETHRENIKGKLDLRSGAELVTRAADWVRGEAKA